MGRHTTGTGNRICEWTDSLCGTVSLTASSYSVNSNYGTADDLKSLASALHDRDMYLMVDVVTNHMVSSASDIRRKTY